ncbi:tRNA (adenosine(37)-N6)-threonylcarbamoyltransferase complex transferase subunit TsaD [Afifella sp. IM 167]|uniref:tRNA (adenosine(37)-N6)-threonylcarbamoyltransferase complex transferase subunit TsaD n=1 Tax=Afifella sp. IM 167 TaxID=2033586 RepID=UPI001CCE6981|nr:tRNA (adenosine(37)-N6)-threonylcarbamoyltransferase complex transferase subunit TsaD [Afifella sp. IM 167]MBZ8134944.1 tRNA (adenosine(37)-N6)-threonylcarbamoyltransferase complex transferase subunit TsaD [Afifella sp. IM 167]
MDRVGTPATLTVLGIETSCDETAAALVSRQADGSRAIRSSVVLSQVEEHRAFGGVVPEIAARAHVEALDGIVAAALDEAGLELADLDGIAVTAGPGLIGCLLVGVTTARALSAASGVPLIGVNHLEGHALTPVLTDGVAFPYLLLLVSGGHTQLVGVAGFSDYRRIGSTIDDALGEAFDKVAKLLGLGYPGGPEVEKAAAGGDPERFALPRPLAGTPGSDFSFSGLKTALRLRAEAIAPLSDRDIADLCASFQAAVAEIVAERTSHALAEGDFTALVAAGGVAANGAIRAALQQQADKAGVPFVAPPPSLCTDNAAMIAFAGLMHLAANDVSADVVARPRWPLDAAAEPMLGSGRLGARV